MLEDSQKLIAAGKTQRWDVIKWTVGLNMGLATAAAIFLNKTPPPAIPTKGPLLILLFSIIIAGVGLSLVLHYFDRMTNARDDAQQIAEYMKKRDIDLAAMTAKAYRQGDAGYDRREKRAFIVAIAASILPAAIAWIALS